MSRRLSVLTASLTVLAAVAASTAIRADEAGPAEFVRAWNLNGPAVEIDGRHWEGRDSPLYEGGDSAFENQSVPLVPPTDEFRALMIRSSRWSHDVTIRFRDFDPGRYQVGVYVWEDNNSERFTVSLQGSVVAPNVESGSAGQWQRLGPFRIEVGDDRTIVLNAQGGAANLSGVEVWSGWGPMPAVGESSVVQLPPISAAAAAEFREHVAPLLSRHCLECHNSSEPRGGLNLSQWQPAMAGGESGAAIVPGDPDSSLAWKHVATDEMPQERPPLTDAEKSILRTWIANGAPWADDTIDPFLATTDRRAGYDWWSLQPVRSPELPQLSRAMLAAYGVTGVQELNPIDAFLAARLESAGLRPAALADRRTLLRRLSFDLIGLPPTPAEIADFEADNDSAAYAMAVDRLLAAPQYGERWARHWLDVIRFGESQGYERNRIRENAWRFRDWVIEAFHRNLPYDEFVRQQIAGDVLYPDDLSALIATGYHVIGTWDQVGDLEGTSEMQKANRQDHLEDLTATFAHAFLGLTVNCARCHDHKFDPISQQDYYRITALLSGVRQFEKEREGITLPAHADRLAERDFAGVAHVSYFEQPPTTFLLARGNYREPRAVIVPAGLQAIDRAGLSGDFGLSPGATDADRRRALAAWVTDPRHPLTARVFVNRVWYHHFGTGLVDTPSDFGFSGGRPSHPELLDFLAARFVESGWDVKALHRLIVSSHAYRQQSQVSNAHAERIDADNRLLWRANRRQLEGESVRDAALFVSGALNPQLGGPSFRDVHVDLKQNHEFTTPTNAFTPETCRRSIYRLWARSGNHPLMDCLDCPDPTVAAPRRNRTITPLQALSLFNNGFMEQCASRFAERVRGDAGQDASAQVRRACALAFGRQPRPAELELLTAFVSAHGLDQACLTLLNSNEFLYID